MPVVGEILERLVVIQRSPAHWWYLPAVEFLPADGSAALGAYSAGGDTDYATAALQAAGMLCHWRGYDAKSWGIPELMRAARASKGMTCRSLL